MFRKVMDWRTPPAPLCCRKGVWEGRRLVQQRLSGCLVEPPTISARDNSRAGPTRFARAFTQKSIGGGCQVAW